MKKILLPLFFIVSIILAYNNLNLTDEVQNLLAQNKVTLVLDGDSLTLASGLRIRLANYDGSPSPERDRLKKAYDFAFQRQY